MSNILDNFKICDKIPKNLKTLIKTFYILEDFWGNNILFVTNEDKVYGLGANQFGSLGLGFSGAVNEPKLINELCFKNIKEFYNGLHYMLALINSSEVYAWGRNNCAQLGKGYKSREWICYGYFKPEKITYFDDKSIVELSCGTGHSLALSTKGLVYGWGYNKYGQIGLGNNGNDYVESPVELHLTGIKHVYCSQHRSFALTEYGRVFSWGQNNYCELGHQIDPGENVFQPKLIDLFNIVTISPSTKNTYFLTDDGDIYYCGLYNLLSAQKYQQGSVLLDNRTNLIDLHQLPNCKEETVESIGVSNDKVYQTALDEFKETEYKTGFDFFAKKFQLTYKTIHITSADSVILDVKEYSSVIAQEDVLMSKNMAQMMKSNDARYKDTFDELGEIGSGAFGKVYKVRDRLDEQIYAIKILSLNEINENALNELKVMAKLPGDSLVQYKTSWVDNNNRIFIQMEYCQDNLKNIIRQKPIVMNKTENQRINPIDYYLSSELFKEILECVKYLHESKPPVIHRDLKPANILITYNNRNGRYLKICDFGLVTYQHMDSVSHTGGAGTLGYMAPEVMRGNKYDTKADIFSAGVIAQELFYTDSDFTLYTESKKDDLIDKKFINLYEMVGKMLSGYYSDRPNCTEMLLSRDSWSIDRKDLDALDIKSDLDAIINENLYKSENEFFQHFLQDKKFIPIKK